jgi:hypothetical protein
MQFRLTELNLPPRMQAIDMDDEADILHRNSDGIGFAHLYCSIIWPEFVEFDDMIFVQMNFTPDYVDQLRSDNPRIKPNRIEGTVNLTYLDNVFGARDTAENVVESVGRTLTRTWLAKAELEFPNRRL